MKSFSDLGLVEALTRAVRDEGYTEPTPIQAQAIPHLLEGRDLLGCARTGTGKTAAFALPMLQRLSGARTRPASRHARTLVIVPTRELAAQVALSFETYGRGLKLAVAVIYGGVGQGPQVRALARGVDVLVATPGRLVDLMGQGHVKLGAVEVLVLDEADHMLDLGFLPDVRRIVGATPKRRQTLLFSATMPPEIAKLADGLLHEPIKVTVTPVASTAELVEQSVRFVSRGAKTAVLAEVLSKPDVERALVFTRTKRGADRVAKALVKSGISAHAIHGNKSQGQRERTLLGFRDGRTRVLVATDIAARGIDVDGITHVINFELPNVPESYVHRIGRTARAGASGVAISLVDSEEREYLRDIEKLTKQKIGVVGDPHGDRDGSSRREPALARSQGRGAAGARAPARFGGNYQRGSSGSRPSGPRRDDARGHERAHERDGAPARGHGGHAPRSSPSSAPNGRAPAHRGGPRSHAPRPPQGHPKPHAKPHSTRGEAHGSDGFGAGI
jgi:ATP-dependent RNA helicase RhlE